MIGRTLPLLAAALLLCSCATAGKAARPAPTRHEALLASPDPALAANKRLVYDFWREIYEAGHLELSEKYLTDAYIQHNPNVPSGRAGFVEFFAKFKKPGPIGHSVETPLIAVTAERDLVILSYPKEYPDPKAPSKTYVTTWFDMFRIENGKIAEHWDSALKK